MAFITLHGMDEAIANLNLHPGTLKSLLTAAIRASFPTEESLREIVALPAEDIIRQLWNVDQPEEIRQKKKNLSSLKSALNKELKELTRQGKNPEGLIISRDNVFTISDEVKNDILQKLGIGTGLDPQDLLSVVRALLDGVMQQGASRQENAASLLQELDRAREKIAQVAGTGAQAPLSSPAPAAGSSPGSPGDAGLAAMERGEGGGAMAEHGGDEPAAGGARQTSDGPDSRPGGIVTGEAGFGDGEAEVVAEQAQILAEYLEIIDEVQDTEETEVIDQDQFLDQEPEFVDEVPAAEEAEEIEQEQIVAADAEIIVEETLPLEETEAVAQEQILADDLEIVAEDEFADTAVGDTGVQESAFPGTGQNMGVAEQAQSQEADGQLPVDEWGEEEATEEIDWEQILDVDEEIVDEALPLAETEILDQDEILEEAAEITDEDLAAAEGEGSGQQDFPAGNTENLAGDEFAGMPIGGTGAQGFVFPGTDQDLPAAGQSEEAGGQLPVDEWIAEEATEEIDREQILDVDTEIVDEALLLAETEVVDQEQIPADDTDIAEKTPMAGTDGSHPSAAPRSDGRQESGQRLDLSHYIDADEALTALPETLVETHDEYIAQILDRFMPKFIRIPAGYYLTGRDRPSHNERPAKKIMLQNFYISQLPVTNDLFDFFVRETGYETDAERTGFGTVVTGRICNSIDPQTGRNVLSISHGTRSQRMQGANWRHPQGPASSLENKANHPVVQVSRHDALAFAAWAGKRLPSEDEWEAAARGAFGFLFPWGNEWQGALANTESSLTGDTTPVTRHGKLSMSPFGVYDLLGNVFEWTSTVAGPKRQATGNAPLIYVLKGGCWTSRTGTTAASRLLETETWSNIIGFRCAV